VVRDEVTAAVKTALEGPVSVVPERRGFERRRGVPDSVFWLTPADDRFTCKPLPILVELEGTFANAVDDFAKFAERYDDENEYQYSVQAPVIGDHDTERRLKQMQYDIIGIRANLLTADDEIKEREMHEELKSWFERFHAKIHTEASVRRYSPQTIIDWSIKFSIFRHRFETVVPFILAGPQSVSEVTISRLSTPTIPGVVVVNNKYDSRDHTELRYKTAVEFPTLHPIRFREPPQS